MGGTKDDKEIRISGAILINDDASAGVKIKVGRNHNGITRRSEVGLILYLKNLMTMLAWSAESEMPNRLGKIGFII